MMTNNVVIKKYIALIGLIFFNHITLAEIITDGHLGARVELPGPNFVIESQLGQERGANLFHSFEKFNLQANESAIFHGGGHLERVITRVTGGQASDLNGQFISQIPQADFYFFNPAGILLGKDVNFEISGSLYLSSADYLTLGEGGYFTVAEQDSSVLTAAPPIAFGFLDHPIGKITVDGSLLAIPTLEASDRDWRVGQPVPAKTLSLVGGDIEINNGILSASGKISLVSVAASGEIPVDSQSLTESFPTQLGKITITNSLTEPETNLALNIGNLTTTNAGGGKIFIQAGQLILDHAYLFADTMGQENGQGIQLNIQERLVLKNASRINSHVFSTKYSLSSYYHKYQEFEPTGNAGNIDITSPIIEINDGSQISSVSELGTYGNAGDITLLAQAYLTIQGSDTIGQSTLSSGILASSWGPGLGGNIDIKTPILRLDQIGEIRTETLGLNRAGNMLIEVDQLNLLGGAQINASTGRFNLGLEQLEGQSGNITISAQQGITIEGEGLFLANNQWIIRHSGILSNTLNQGTGGLITLTTPNLTINHHGQIQSASNYNGHGGWINITAPQLQMNQGSLTTHSNGNGFAGNISLQTQKASLIDSQITTNAHSSGGGDMDINIVNQLDLINSQISAQAQGELPIHQGGNLTFGQASSPQIISLNNSQLLANAYAGNGGNIQVIANHLILSSDSLLDASSELGIDGEIKLEATNRIFDEVEILPTIFAQNRLTNSCNPLTSPLSSLSSTFIILGRGGLSENTQEMQH